MEAQALPPDSAVHLEQIHPIGCGWSIHFLLQPGSMVANGSRKTYLIILPLIPADRIGMLQTCVGPSRWSFCSMVDHLRSSCNVLFKVGTGLRTLLDVVTTGELVLFAITSC